MSRSFASDNYSGVHPVIMEALSKANEGHAVSYGADIWTERAIGKFKKHFGDDTDVYFVYNGTGANVSALSTITQSYNAIICSDLAHINVDESTAPEKFSGCKLIAIPTKDGKIYPNDVSDRIQRIDDQHHPQAKVISISQVTEYGTVYSIEEIKSLAEVAKKHNLFLHMDGSRISNAAVSLDKNFREFTLDAGVDVLSFGGAKNGMMFGEAVLFFNKQIARPYKFVRKQSMQLHSKMRFIGAQFEALLNEDLWKNNATHSNSMAKRLESEIKDIPKIRITQKVDANSIFAIFPHEIIKEMQDEFFFYVWNDRTNEVRLMCSFDTQEEDVDGFASNLRQLIETTA